MTIDRPLSVRPTDGGEYVCSAPPQSWITTIDRLRGLCGLWLVAILALAFLPDWMPPQPAPKVQTARRVSSDALASTMTSDDETDDAFTPDDSSKPAKRSEKNRAPNLLVLKNGRLVEGQISQSAGGYVVDRPNGSLLVPFDRVSFEAEDRTDAYRKVRSKMPARTAGSNIALARWCLSYDMLDEAEAELREALEIEPHREEARTMLARLEEIRNPDAPLNKETPRHEPKTDDGFQAPGAESLGGFAKETAQEFVTRIQPMLVNRCGNASCHGGREPANGFPLILVKNGQSNRASAERNLATVMRHIDLESPDRSPVVTLSQGNHGGAKALFHGPKAAEQLDTLRDWVRKAAREELARQGDSAARPAIASAAAPKKGRPTAAEHEPPVITPAPDNDFNPPRIPTGKQPPADIVRKTLKEEQPDPFDPDEFNRPTQRK